MISKLHKVAGVFGMYGNIFQIFFVNPLSPSPEVSEVVFLPSQVCEKYIFLKKNNFSCGTDLEKKKVLSLLSRFYPSMLPIILFRTQENK